MVLNLKANIDSKYHNANKDHGQSIDLSTKSNITAQETSEEQEKLEEADAKVNKSLSWETFTEVMKFCGITILNLAAVGSKSAGVLLRILCSHQFCRESSP